ncbi:MAG: DUF2061 domain-containing protein [bacterium]
MHHEKRNRSIAKAITYRIISIFMDTVIAFYVTHSASKTMAFVLISNSVSIIVYFIHERAWNRVHWGKHTITIEE